MKYVDFHFLGRKYLSNSRIATIIYDRLLCVRKERIALKEKETLLEKLGKVLSIAGNAIMMNLLFLAACIPVVTMGAAWNGLLSAIRYNVRGERWFEGFKAGFTTRFWRSLLSWVIMLVPILMVLEFDVISALLDETGAFRAWESFTVDGLVRLAFACIMALVLTGLNGALILLNVYIPTSVGNWIRNAANLVFSAPLQLAAVGLLMWFPLLLIQLMPSWFYFFVMVFVVAYFVLAGLGITVLMKQPLIDCLVDARIEGTLIEEREEEIEERSDEDNG